MKQLPLNKGLFALVDDDIYEQVKHLTWFASYNGREDAKPYARTKYNGEVIILHLFVMQEERKKHPGMLVDHENRNTLDCQRNNLRMVTHAENINNRDWEAYAQKRAAKAVGVCYCKHANKWKAYYRRKHLGWFMSQEAALTARKRAVEGVF